jgi:Putative transposase
MLSYMERQNRVEFLNNLHAICINNPPPEIMPYGTKTGEDFLHLILQHVLPKGLRRVRDYGFLHGNAKKLLSLVQLILHVVIEVIKGSIKNNLVEFALEFAVDLIDLIEQNRRNSELFRGLL